MAARHRVGESRDENENKDVDMFKRARQQGRHRVGGKPFEHASGAHDPVSVIAEHSLPSDLEATEFETPHGYRARSVQQEPEDHRRSA